MKPFFTLALSCCNVAPYLGECFGSILSQPFADWECVVWVEESDDDTLAIARGFAARDPRIRVFTGPRTGSCSVSRNKGIELARGEYILFVDGDDLLAPGALRRIHGRMAAHPGADIFVGALRKFRHGTGEILSVIDNYPAGLAREMTGAEAIFRQASRWPTNMLQLAVYRLGFLRSAGLACLEGVRGQDNEFFPRALYLARTVVPLHEVNYLYRFRANSVQTSQMDRLDRFHGDLALVFRSLLAFYAAVSREDGFDRRVAAFWAKSWVRRRIALEWFRPECLETVSRDRRVNTLSVLFAGGFGAFDSLCRAGGAQTRLVGWWIKLFVLCPHLRGAAELFFRTYASMNGLKKCLRARDDS